MRHGPICAAYWVGVRIGASASQYVYYCINGVDAIFREEKT